MKVLVATDAWHPQVNGVVCTYERLAQEVHKFGAELIFLTPADFATIPCPTYPEIRLALTPPGAVTRRIAEIAPDFIHIATEGPVGLMARSYCINHSRPFTTSYHTRFPEYLAARLPLPSGLSLAWAYAAERWFHNRAAATFVATASVSDDLKAHGFKRLMRWSRGVDTELFRPRPVRHFGQEPVFLYVGRIAVEKNIEAFLELDLPGRKVLTGGGPKLAELKRRFPDAVFTGPKHGEELAEIYASADVFVFPSRTDTFGLVLLEAMASGVPVAAFPVSGPRDVVADSAAGVLSEDLQAVALKALNLDRAAARAHALKYSWEQSAVQFMDNVLTANEVIPGRRLRIRRRTPAEGAAPQRAGHTERAGHAQAHTNKRTARLGGNRAVSHCVGGDAWGKVRHPGNG